MLIPDGRLILRGNNVCRFSILIGLLTDAFEPLYDGRFTFPYQLETEKNVEK